MRPVGHTQILSDPLDISNMHYNLYGNRYSCLPNSKNICILRNVGNTGVICLEKGTNEYLSLSRVMNHLVNPMRNPKQTIFLPKHVHYPEVTGI